MPEAQRFKAVVFDFGGVFTTSPIENYAAYERWHGLPERFIGGVIKAHMHDGAFARYERGEITLDAFDQMFAEETRKAGHEIYGRRLIGLLSVRLRPEMVRAFERVREAGFKTGCITNTMPRDGAAADYPHAGDVARIFASFDHVIESSKVGVRKPEPRIYEMMIEALRVEPCACVFLDDLGVNLKPARAMGMATIKVPFGDVGPAINELSVLLEVDL
jgi:putative hydrolase of the HAD superfamily